MTEDSGRRTEVVPVNGRSIVIRELTKLQLMHIARYGSILSNDNVAGGDKMAAVERMMDIMHSVVAQDSDREYLIEQEERGVIELDDLMGFINAFKDEPAEEKPTVKRTRGPARARR